MHTRTTLLRQMVSLAALVLLLIGGVLPAAAQGGGDTDGDGLPDRVDNCPTVAGPRENGGCPWPDTDGDGLIDLQDKCPDRAGPRENSGCPLDPTPAPPTTTENQQPGASQPPTAPEPPPAEPTTVPVVLPDLPLDGPCVVGTQGAEGVNVRLLPAREAAIIGSLDPTQLYGVLMQFQTAEGKWWLLAGGGFVADWVTRAGGGCENVLIGLLLPAVQKVRWAGQIPSPGEWGDPHIWEWGDPHVPVFLAQFGPDGNPVGGWAFGLTEDGQLVLFPGSLVGFDPQPDPPGEAQGFDPQPDPPGETEGFDPQPEPPGVMVFVDPPDPDLGLLWAFGDGSVKSCDGSVMPASFMMGDGSVKPGDGSVMPDGLSILYCDGSVMPSWLLPASEGDEAAGDGSVMPSWLLPAVGGDSVMPSWLLPANVFPGGQGKALGCMPYGDPAAQTAACMFTDGTSLALCDVSPEGASCLYSQF